MNEVIRKTLRTVDSSARSAHTLRKGGDMILTGRARYVDDNQPSNLHYASILRADRAHARIRSIDTNRARTAPGVKAVLTGQEALALVGPMEAMFAPELLGWNAAEFRCLAVDKVRWFGQPIVAIAADTLAHADAARALIQVEYEDLPVVLELQRALAEGATKVFETWNDNILGAMTFAEGDADARLAEAPHILRDRLKIGRHQPAPLELRSYVASWTNDDQLTLWAPTQNPHQLRTALAGMLGFPEDQIRIVVDRVGGSFGYKMAGYPEEVLVCVLSRMVRAPVKWRETRSECLMVGGRDFEHAFEIGFDDHGRLLAFKVETLGNVGAIESWSGWSMTIPAALTYPGPYRIKDYSVRVRAVATNKTPSNGYRGYGKEQATIVLERMMDLIAGKLSIDPADVRMRNYIPPHEFPYWTVSKRLDSGEYKKALEHVMALGDYVGLRAKQQTALREGRRLGIGLILELCPEGADIPNSRVRGIDTSTVRIQPSGSVVVLTGVTSPGTGNETSIAQLVATELGVSVDSVRVVQGDTDVCPYGYGNFSSRSISSGGSAAVLAARELRSRVAKAAAALLQGSEDDVEIAENLVSLRSDAAKAMPFAALTKTIYQLNRVVPGVDQTSLEVTKTEGPNNYFFAPDDQGRMSLYPCFPYSAHLAMVEVDEDTGVIRVLDYSVVDDCGTVISPKFVEGQVLGAVAQGIGGILWEDLPLDPATGASLAKTLKHYLLPRATDLPEIRIGHEHTPSPFTLLGTKGAGETGIGGAMAAIYNAVNDALRPLGVSVRQTPLNPQTVLSAIKASEATA
jgi:aerobic carbon-monoxide dehydrogenase large subunit